LEKFLLIAMKSINHAQKHEKVKWQKYFLKTFLVSF